MDGQFERDIKAAAEAGASSAQLLAIEAAYGVKQKALTKANDDAEAQSIRDKYAAEQKILDDQAAAIVKIEQAKAAAQAKTLSDLTSFGSTYTLIDTRTKQQVLADTYATQKAQLTSEGATNDQLLALQKGYNAKLRELNDADAKAQADAIAAAQKVITDGYKKTGDTITSSMTDALKKGVSKTDFSKTISDMMLNMTIDAAVLAGGFADKFTTIGQKIAEAIKTGMNSDIISSLKDQISSIYAGAQSTVKTVTDLFSGVTTGSIQGFASGTLSAPGGLSLVGEKGPELVNLPRGSQVYPTDQTQSMLSGSGGKSITINVQSNAPLNPLETARAVKSTMESLAFQGVA